MKEVDLSLFQANLIGHLKQANTGTPILISDKGTPVARLLPVFDKTTTELNYFKTLANDMIERILPIMLMLSKITDINQLVEKILYSSQELCNADGGTLYLRGKGFQLKYVMVHTKSLKISAGGTTGNPIPFAPLHTLNEKTGEPNLSNIATNVAFTGKTVNVADVYTVTDFDVTGSKSFDKQYNYKTRSCLTVPIQSEDGVLGVLQLVNAQNPKNNSIIPFDEYKVRIVESLAMMVALILKTHVGKPA